MAASRRNHSPCKFVLGWHPSTTGLSAWFGRLGCEAHDDHEPSFVILTALYRRHLMRSGPEAVTNILLEEFGERIAASFLGAATRSDVREVALFLSGHRTAHRVSDRSLREHQRKVVAAVPPDLFQKTVPGPNAGAWETNPAKAEIGRIACKLFDIRVTFPDELLAGAQATLRIEE